MELIAAVRGKDINGNELKMERKIHILLVAVWFMGNIIMASLYR